ncbi:MFS transporter [Acinetobacter indicus]|uniref:MFS transporter n=1 Tax=Acinetobacter indicus TaxID=756892 RepID=UPI003F675903
MSNAQSWQPFLMVSLALCIGTVGTALASPLYPLYQELWQLLPSHITYLFVAYIFGCLATLLFLGRTSNRFGFVRSLQVGIALVTVGLILSAWAPTALYLGLGRFIIGIASGLITTSAMLGLMNVVPDSHKLLAPQLSSIITAIGFGLGPFLGGVIAQFAEQPLVTPYLPVIVSAIFCGLGLFKLKQPAFEQQPFSVYPKLQTPDAPYQTAFFLVSFAAFCAFAGFSLFASLSPSFVQDILPWHGPLVSGVAISAILIISAIVQFFARSVLPATALRWGLYALLGSLLLLGLCMSLQWSPLFFVSDVLVGIGHGLSLLGAFGLIHQMSQPHNRAAIMSSYLFIAYLGTIVPIIAVGYLSDHFGLSVGIISFCMLIGLLCLSLIWQQRKVLTF